MRPTSAMISPFGSGSVVNGLHKTRSTIHITTGAYKMSKLYLRRGIPTVAIAAALVLFSATSGATAALVITGKQIKDNSVTTYDVKNGTLKTQDLAAGAVSALKGATGPTGPQGATGPAGPQGPAGAPGLSGREVVNNSASIASSGVGSVEATCPAGKSAISVAGSFSREFTGIQTGIFATSGIVWGENISTSADDLNIQLVCAVVS